MTAESVDIQPGQTATGLEGDVGGVSFGADIIRIDGIDAAGREAVWLLIHTLKAHQSRELVISGTRAVRSGAIVRVLSFKSEPDPIQEQVGKAALPFTLPEKLIFRAVTALLRRRQE